MIEHIVLFRWMPEAAPEAIARVMEELRGLRDKIPGIIDLTCGEDFSGRAQGYTHGLVVRFTTSEALDAYGPHPAHQHVVKTLINPIRDAVLAFDFEITAA